MALFGAPVAHDDDPLRAARAALDIHEGLARLSDSVGRVLRAHIGIASGEVVAGALAARLVAAAGSAETLISASVRNALAGRAVCESHGEMALKGIAGSVALWQLRGLSSEPTATRTPFVGREAELEQIRSTLGSDRSMPRPRCDGRWLPRLGRLRDELRSRVLQPLLGNAEGGAHRAQA